MLELLEKDFSNVVVQWVVFYNKLLSKCFDDFHFEQSFLGGIQYFDDIKIQDVSCSMYKPFTRS